MTQLRGDAGERQVAAPRTALAPGLAAETRWGPPRVVRVRYEDLWPGVDLVVRLGRDGLEYDLELEPGADLGTIALDLQGVRVACAPCYLLAHPRPPMTTPMLRGVG